MATKKRAKVPAPLADDTDRPDSATDVETDRSMDVDADVERADSNVVPRIESVESERPGTPRIDVEGGDAAGDVERGPANPA
jgi:hypothetical protein